MKLAEALVERADKQRRLAELESRIIANAVFQEGDTPPENAEDLISEFNTTALDIERLMKNINVTNNETLLEDGTTMVAALAKRDMLKKRHQAYRRFAAAVTPGANRYSSSEIRYVGAIDVKKLQKKADGIAKDAREIDILIQQANWLTDLKE